MNTTQRNELSVHVGDHVALRGTRVFGEVASVSGTPDHLVSVKVTGVRGKSPKSKKARAFRGAWVTCGREMVDSILTASN